MIQASQSGQLGSTLYICRQVETKRATPRDKSAGQEAGLTVKKVFVGGIKEEAEDDEIKEYFTQVLAPYDKTPMIKLAPYENTDSHNGTAHLQ